MSGPDRPIRPENRVEARRWLVIVEEDIDVAAAAARISRLGASAYHVQQAAEKLIGAGRRGAPSFGLGYRLPVPWPGGFAGAAAWNGRTGTNDCFDEGIPGRDWEPD